MEIFKLYGSVLIDTEKAMSSMQKLVGEADKLGTKVGNSFKNVGSTLTSIGDKLTSAGAKMTATITTPLAALGTKALTIAGDVDKTMQLVKSTMGATTSEAEKLDMAIEKAASNSILTVNDAATAMLNFARQGYTAEDAISLLEPAMALAVGTGSDLDEVSSGLGNSLKAFNLSAKDSKSVTDLLAKAQASANTTTSDLLKAIEIAGPVFKTAGWDLDDLATVTGMFGDKSIDASEGATALKTGIARLMAPKGTDAITWMQKLGFMTEDLDNNFVNADGTCKTFSETLAMLCEGFSGLSEAERIQAASAIFGKNQYAKFLALIDSGVETFDRLNQKILENEGYCQMLSDSLMQGLGGSIESLKASFDVFMKNVGDSLGRVLMPLIEYITELLDKFNALDSETQDRIVKIGLVVAAIGPLLLILGTLCGALGNIISFTGTIINLVAKAPAAIGAITSALGKIPAILEAVGSFFTSTFGAIAMIIGGAILAVKEFVDMWRNGWDVIKTILEALGIALIAVGAIILGAPALITAVIAAIIFALSQLVIVIHDHWDEICQWCSEACENIKQWWSEMCEAIKEKWQEFKDWLAETWESIKEAFVETWTAIKEFFIEIWTGIKEFFIEIWTAIKDFFIEVWEGIRDFFVELWDSLVQKIQECIDAIIEFVTDMWNRAVEWFENVKQTIHDLLETIKEKVKNALEWIRDKGREFIENVKTKVTELKDKIIETVKDMFETVKNKVQESFEWIKNKLHDFLENAKNKIKEFIDHVLEKVKAFKEKVINTLRELFDQAKQKFEEMIIRLSRPAVARERNPP